MRAAVYTRISRNESGDLLGVRRQEKACRALCEDLGWTVAAIYQDNDVSAYSGRSRPGYEQMMAALESGDVGAVVAWHPDRLHRSPKELERFIDVVDARKAKVRTVQSGELDLSTAAGRMTARVVGAVARHESEHKSARLVAKAAELAAAGAVSGGGSRPFGFQPDRVKVDRREAKLIREAVRRVLAGGGVRSVCSDFDRRGITTPTGRSWHPQVMKRLLISARIAGLRSHRGTETKAVWPSIITESEHRQIVALLTDPARRLNRAPRSYLLTGGLAVCGLPGCHANLVARPRGDGTRSMVCATGPGRNGCGKIRILAEPLEDLISEAVLQSLDDAEMPEVDDDSHDDTSERYAVIEARQVELAGMFAAGEINSAEWRAAKGGLEVERVALQDETRSHRSDTAVQALLGGGDHRAAWKALPLERRKAVIAALVDHVTVGPAVRGLNRFDPLRVDIKWRV